MPDLHSPSPIEPAITKAYGRSVGFFNARTVAALLFVLALVTAVNPAQAEPAKILAFGDSLTAGYGLPPEESFTEQLEQALRAAGQDVVVQNAGVSGDTTAGGRARLAWTLADRPDLVILELGGNDGLRGIDPADTRANLDAMLNELKTRNIPVLFTGMRAPPNLGRDYTDEFDGLFAALAQKYDVPLYPFFLDGVAAQPKLNQPDGIHPNAAGVAIIVERLKPYVIAALNGDRPATAKTN